MVHGDLPTRLNVFQHSSRNSVRIVHSLEVSELGDIVPVRLAFGFNFLEAPENLVNSVRAAILEEIARLKMSTDAVKLV